MKILSCVRCTLSILLITPAGMAHAETSRSDGHRSGASLPAVVTKSSALAPAAKKNRDLPDHVGPRQGFRDNHGLTEALEHASEHSAHHRDHDDSPGR